LGGGGWWWLFLCALFRWFQHRSTALSFVRHVPLLSPRYTLLFPLSFTHSPLLFPTVPTFTTAVQSPRTWRASSPLKT
jgi:hypothetical protein